MKKWIYNINEGNLFPCTTTGLKEARKEAKELYDIDDPTNFSRFWDYYMIITA